MVRIIALGLVLMLVVLVLGACPSKNAVTPEGKGPSGSPAAPAASTGPRRVVEMYVPCGLILPLREAAAAFEKAHPDVKIEGKFDNAITLVKMIRDKGDRPDLYVSPGAREIGLLEEKGLIEPTSKTVIGEFDLVLIVPRDNPKQIHSLQDITRADVITCPNPKENSVGMYGEQALRKAGLWDKLMPKGEEKIVFTDKAIASYEKVAAGRADVGVAFRNCPLQTNPEKLKKSAVQIACEIDQSLYEKPLCYMALLKEAKNATDGRAFVAFLGTPEAEKVMKENGMQLFARPGGTAAGAQPTASPPKPVSAKPLVTVQAFYPDNEDHAWAKKLVVDIDAQYQGKVKAEFIAFNTDEGYQRWKAAGMTCGGLLVNGKQTCQVMRKGKKTEVTFMMKEGGEWTKADLEYAIKEALKAAEKKG
jgi:molybdate transport system substrate-binding protein